MTKSWIRVGVCALLGALGGFVAFGSSPLILLGVLFGFLTGRTWVGLVEPGPDTNAGSLRVSSPAGSLWLVVLGWGGAIAVMALAANLGMFGSDGSGLVFMLVIVPLLSVCGLLAGPTATSAARRALRQVESGERPASERSLAQWALGLSHLTTAALVGFLIWLFLQVYR